jgi:D-galacturonate reductase
MREGREQGSLLTQAQVGTNGSKFPTIRQHFRDNISARYNGLDVQFESFPADDQSDPQAYVAGKSA